MAIVSAILVIVAEKAKPEYVWLSIVPIILFYFLDSYYLGLERGFRDRYNEFVRKLHEERASLGDVFIVCPAAGALTMRAARSMSVLPLYLLLAALLVLVRLAVLA